LKLGFFRATPSISAPIVALHQPDEYKVANRERQRGEKRGGERELQCRRRIQEATPNDYNTDNLEGDDLGVEILNCQERRLCVSFRLGGGAHTA
jgi:hypothetical protein